MKIAPIVNELDKRPGIQSVLVHTGQHYDEKMSSLFFEELSIPKPDRNLEVGSGSQAVQTALIMQRFESVVEEEHPDLVIVVGDVNSTLACSLTAVKMNIPVAHVEAGLRSFDRSMPEEINRILTDAISSYLFVTEKSGVDNLLNEGIPESKIHLVGNVMIDTLLKNRENASRSKILDEIGVQQKSYGLVTLHRPSNVDSPEVLGRIINALRNISTLVPLVFPCHPRTQEKLKSFKLLTEHWDGNEVKSREFPIKICNPLGYLDFLKLMSEARIVLSDSGGIQEETTILGTPCVTLRENTERPVTISEGTNVLVGTDEEKIVNTAKEIINNEKPEVSRMPDFWDGKAAGRIVDILFEQYLA